MRSRPRNVLHVDRHASRGIRGRRERRKGRIEDGEVKEAVSDRTRGLLSGSTAAETARWVYPLHVEEVYLRQRDAFFKGTTTTTTTTTRCVVAPGTLLSIRRTMASRCSFMPWSTWFIFRRWHSIMARVFRSRAFHSRHYVVENQRTKSAIRNGRKTTLDDFSHFSLPIRCS